MRSVISAGFCKRLGKCCGISEAEMASRFMRGGFMDKLAFESGSTALWSKDHKEREMKSVENNKSGIMTSLGILFFTDSSAISY